jgi:hypothetical protein
VRELAAMDLDRREKLLDRLNPKLPIEVRLLSFFNVPFAANSAAAGYLLIVVPWVA